MSNRPPIPSEQKPFKGAPNHGRDETKIGVTSHERTDTEVNLDEHGAQGNLRQNMTPQRKIQNP